MYASLKALEDVSITNYETHIQPFKQVIIMRTREEIEKDMAALFVGGCQDRIMTITEHKYRNTMIGKYRKELDELEALKKQEKNIHGKNKKNNHK